MYLIYSKTGCVYCDKAKELLENEDKIIIDCDQMLKNNRDDFIKEIEARMRKPFRTFPVIFSDNIYLGGYDDLVNHLSFKLDETF